MHLPSQYVRDEFLHIKVPTLREGSAFRILTEHGLSFASGPAIVSTTILTLTRPSSFRFHSERRRLGSSSRQSNRLCKRARLGRSVAL